MHWSPECAKATFNKVQEALSGNMSCLSICSEALVAAVPAPEVTDEVSIALLHLSTVAQHAVHLCVDVQTSCSAVPKTYQPEDNRLQLYVPR